MTPIEFGITILFILLIIYSLIGIVKPYWVILLSKPITWMLFGLMSFFFKSSTKNIKEYDMSRKEIDEYKDKNVIMHKGNIYKKSDLISGSGSISSSNRVTKRLLRFIRILSVISLITLIISFIYVHIFVI